MSATKRKIREIHSRKITFLIKVKTKCIHICVCMDEDERDDEKKMMENCKMKALNQKYSACIGVDSLMNIEWLHNSS